ncbi:hypothetical protein [Methylobacterium sp. J-090]|uniref:hypothetical protein n=1 Tax=Methylobacterium sp. J-090 TaxID=2836666 RepID=UPI001FB964CC|nr:hypothetical protein [Methylobacterium sp. J-090]MCJ2082489.1 hypothetical protein [Methylobacterium sp. J-090]
MNDMSNIPHQPRIPMLRFGRYDRIRIGDVEYGNPLAAPGGHVFHRIDAPDLAQEFSHEEIWHLSKRRDWAVDPDWFAPQSARSRLATGLENLDDLAAKELSDVVFKWEHCIRFLRQEKAGTYNRTPESLKQAIAENTKAIRLLDVALVPKGTKRAPKSGTGGASSKSRNLAKRRARAAAKRKAYVGNKVVMELREPPSDRSLLRWLKLLEKLGTRPASLRETVAIAAAAALPRSSGRLSGSWSCTAIVTLPRSVRGSRTSIATSRPTSTDTTWTDRSPRRLRARLARRLACTSRVWASSTSMPAATASRRPSAGSP